VTLQEFFIHSYNAIENKPLNIAIGEVILKFIPILLDENIKRNMPLYDNIAYERMNGFTVLTHNHPEKTFSPPHDHGSEWVIYGVLDGVTVMTDFIELPNNKLTIKAQYSLVPGQFALYRVGEIHAHHATDFSKYIRLESRNLHREDSPIYGKLFDFKDIITA
jgi:hypothetical protein